MDTYFQIKQQIKIIEDHIVDNILIDNTLNKINRFVKSFAKAIK